MVSSCRCKALFRALEKNNATQSTPEDVVWRCRNRKLPTNNWTTAVAINSSYKLEFVFVVGLDSSYTLHCTRTCIYENTSCDIQT
eukprot:CFRG2332T1